MSHVGSKGVRAAGTMRAETLTSGGEAVPGVLPRAQHHEMKRMREAVDQFDYTNPEMWQYANNQKMRRYLTLACNRISELERKLAEMIKGGRP